MDLQDTDGIESDKFVIFQQDDLHVESFPLMKEIRRLGKLCDVTLKVSKNAIFMFCFYFLHCFDLQINDFRFYFLLIGRRPIILRTSGGIGCYNSVFLCYVHT